jgi:methyl-accepting chemotaxis protein
MKISVKLYSGFTVIVILMLTLASITYVNLSRLSEANTWNEHTYKVLSEVQGILESLINIETGQRGFALSGIEASLEPYHGGKEAFETHFTKVTKLTSDNPKQQQRFKQLNDSYQQWMTQAIDPANTLRRDVVNGINTMDKVIAFEQAAKGKTAMDAMRVLIGDIQAEEKRLLTLRKGESSALEETTLSLLVSLSTLATVLAGIIAFFIIRRITRPLKIAVEVANEIAQGNLNSEIKVTGSDETAELLNAMQTMTNTLQEFSSAQQEMAMKHESGIVDHFVNAENFPGIFGQLAKENNELVASNIDITMKAVEVTSRYAAGDLSSTMDRLPGQRAQITEAVDGIKNSLQAISAEIKDLVESAVAGNFAARGNESKFQNEFKDMIVGLNKLMETSDTGLNDVSRVLTAMSRGHLNETIEGDYQGTFNKLKEGSNTTGKQLRAMVAQIKAMVSAAGAGDFSVRGDTNQYQNEFRDMVAGLNQLMETSDTGLGEVSRVLKALARCDLTDSIKGEYQGTFLQVKEDANTTVEQLRLVVEQISQASDAISAGASQIASGNQDLSTRTEQQASNLEETSAAMEEFQVTVENNANSSNEAKQLADTTNVGVVKGGDAVMEVAVTMSEIQANSEKIADIIGVIDSIAFQTNILALNAAVEAARAGEEGRGFSVVASEVRNLAQRSANAAKEIKDLISTSVAKVNTGAKQVKNTETAMNEAVLSCKQVALLVTQISEASREQSSGVTEVTRAVGQMDEATQQNSTLVEEAAAAAERLQSQAGNLVQMVSKFKQA